MFLDFPPQEWVHSAISGLTGEHLQQIVPLCADDLRSVANNILRWQPAVLASTDDDEMLAGEKSSIRKSIGLLVAWATQLENPIADCIRQRGRVVYSARLLLRALQCSVLLHNKSKLVEAVTAASHLVFPGLAQSLEDEVDAIKVPSRSHVKRAHLLADACLIEFERRTRASKPSGFYMYGWADSTPLKHVRSSDVMRGQFVCSSPDSRSSCEA